jgi:hypothetical protein
MLSAAGARYADLGRRRSRPESGYREPAGPHPSRRAGGGVRAGSADVFFALDGAFEI